MLALVDEVLAAVRADGRALARAPAFAADLGVVLAAVGEHQVRPERAPASARVKFEISEATSWGRVVVRCLTFLPTHLEPVIQGLIM